MGNALSKYKFWIITGIIIILAVVVWKIGDSGQLALWLGGLGTFFKSIFTKEKKSEEDHNAEVKALDDQISSLQTQVEQKQAEAAVLETRKEEVKEAIAKAPSEAREEVARMSDKELRDYLNSMFD